MVNFAYEPHMAHLMERWTLPTIRTLMVDHGCASWSWVWAHLDRQLTAPNNTHESHLLCTVHLKLYKHPRSLCVLLNGLCLFNSYMLGIVLGSFSDRCNFTHGFGPHVLEQIHSWRSKPAYSLDPHHPPPLEKNPSSSCGHHYHLHKKVIDQLYWKHQRCWGHLWAQSNRHCYWFTSVLCITRSFAALMMWSISIIKYRKCIGV